jgi:hypothetical protein
MSSPGLPIPPPGAGAPPGGAPPPAMGHPPQPQQPGGTGAVTAPRPQMGNQAQSLTLVHTALDALQRALVGIPMGSDLHTAILRCIQELSKKTNMEGGDKASQMQALAQMGRGLQQNPQQAALQRLQPPPGQPGPATPPAM